MTEKIDSRADGKRRNGDGRRMCDAPGCCEKEQLRFMAPRYQFCTAHYNKVDLDKTCSEEGCELFAMSYGDVNICDRHRHDYELNRAINLPNGKHLCHARGCRERYGLRPIYGGMFCSKHEDDLTVIRQQVTMVKDRDNITEATFRLQETDFRKQHDKGHMHRINQLRGDRI